MAILALGCTVATLLAAGLPDKDEAFIGARRNYWAFRKPVRPDVPPANSNWVRTSDRRVHLWRICWRTNWSRRRGAAREQLLRRAYLDVIGLPPTPEEIKSFLDDRSADAYTKLIDRLMASPHYGERIGLKWLDVVRYADTNGFEADARASRRLAVSRLRCARRSTPDKPYDRFIREQIAGDELYPGDTDALLGLGFLRSGPRHVVGGNVDQEMTARNILSRWPDPSDRHSSALPSAARDATITSSIQFCSPITIACRRSSPARISKISTSRRSREERRYEEREKEYEARLKPITDQDRRDRKAVSRTAEAERTRASSTPHAAVLNMPK